MSARAKLIAYFEDLARRHVDIAHDPATTDTRRFWLGTEDQAIIAPPNITQPSNRGWNLLFVGYVTKRDHNAGRHIEQVMVVLQVLKHCKERTPEAITAIHNTAHAIGTEIFNRVLTHVKDPCNAELSDGIEVPYDIEPASFRATEAPMRFDNYHGYEFAFTVEQYEQITTTPNPAKWRDL